ncbi:MAG: dihydroorotate dehydrogenase (NAD+) catalytic subunit [Chlamydiales bacterium]|jgi:dihydroorotate dehydrogenase (NAD+) catalytic subunit
MADLTVAFAGLELRSPILSASGTFGHGLEMQHIVPASAVGGLVSKTVTMDPRPGNPMPRICETEAGFLNSIGLENRGIEAYLEHTLPEMAEADTVVIANIGAKDAEEFGRIAAILDARAEVDVLEVNLSCPNVQGGRLPYSTDPRVAEEVIRNVRAATRKPIFAKLSPNVTRIADIAIAVESGGADGITAINTLLGMGVDWRTGKPALNTIQGGYSGPAIKPVALRCAWECAQAVQIPIMGCGGIRTAADVLEFLVVGCSAVQVGTASFSDPGLLGLLATELEHLLDAHGKASVRELIGTIDMGKPKAMAPGSQS